MTEIVEAIGKGVVESLMHNLPLTWGKLEATFDGEFFGRFYSEERNISITVTIPQHGKPVAKIYGLPSVPPEAQEAFPHIVFRCWL